MLIPFLDILCSLIGVLVLIIVVLVVAQTQKINGRTQEELVRAQSHQKLLKQQKENERINALLGGKVSMLETLREQAKAKEQEVAKLRMLINNSAANKQLSQNLLKELDNLLLEISGLTAHEVALKKEIEELMAEIKKRQPPEQKGARVVVQPGGSGLAQGTTVFFVEATSGKLTFYWDEKTKGIVSAVPEVIAVDSAFNSFLKAVGALPQTKLIFLLRDDGMGAYNLGAGWAQATYGYRVDQIGKLPIPGRGEIDLHMFGAFLGSLKPTLESPTPVPAPVAPPK